MSDSSDVKSAGFLFISLIVSRALGYITRLLIAKNFGAGDYGLVYLGASIFGLITVFCLFGLPQALERYIPEFRVKKEWRKIKGVIIGSLKISLILAIFFGALLFIFSPQISIIFFNNSNLTNILRIFSFALPFAVASSIFVFATRGFQTIKYDVYSLKIGKSVLTIIFVSIFILLGFGVLSVALSYALAIVFASFLSFYFLEKKVFPILKTKIKSKNITKKILSFSAPLMLSNLMWNIVIYIDTIMVGYFLAAKDVGVYQAAAPTAQLMMIISVSLLSLFLPIMSDLFARKKHRELENVYSTVTKWSFYINLPFLFIFLIFPKAILNVFFGGEFVSGFLALSVLSVGFIFHSFGNLFSQIINLHEKTKLHFYNNIFAMLLAVVLNFLLIPLFGVTGAAFATTITLISLTIIRMYQAYKISKIWPFKSSILKSLLAVVISGSITILIKGFLVPSLVMLFLLGIFFFIFYAFLLLIFRALDKEDVMILKSIEQKTGLRIEWLRNLIKKFV